MHNFTYEMHNFTHVHMFMYECISQTNAKPRRKVGTPRGKRASHAQFDCEDREPSPCRTPIGGWDTEGLFVLEPVCMHQRRLCLCLSMCTYGVSGSVSVTGVCKLALIRCVCAVHIHVYVYTFIDPKTWKHHMTFTSKNCC